MEDTNNLYEKQMKVSLIQFLSEMPNFIFVLLSALLSGNLIMYMDLIDSSSAVVHNGFLVFMSKKLKKDLRFSYNYGIGKIEAISSLCCELIVLMGSVIVVFNSVSEIISPKRPSDLLVYIVFMKIINIVVDGLYMRRQKRMQNMQNTKIIKTEFINAKEALIFDVIAFFALIIAYSFRDYRPMWYFSPILCLLMAIYFSQGGFVRAKNAIDELTDKTLDEKIQLKIMKMLTKHFYDYEELISVNSHIIGTEVIIDLEVSFENKKTYEEIKEFLNTISKELNEEIPNSKVNILIENK